MGSRAEQGSSIRTIRDCRATIRAIAEPLLLFEGQSSGPTGSVCLLGCPRDPRRKRPGRRFLPACPFLKEAGHGPLRPKMTFSRMERGKGLGRWKTMPTSLRSLNQIGSRGVNVFIPDQDLPFDSNPVNQVIHPVQTAQQSGFPAARGADQGGDGLFFKKGRYALSGHGKNRNTNSDF